MTRFSMRAIAQALPASRLRARSAVSVLALASCLAMPAFAQDSDQGGAAEAVLDAMTGEQDAIVIATEGAADEMAEDAADMAEDTAEDMAEDAAALVEDAAEVMEAALPGAQAAADAVVEAMTGEAEVLSVAPTAEEIAAAEAAEAERVAAEEAAAAAAAEAAALAEAEAEAAAAAAAAEAEAARLTQAQAQLAQCMDTAGTPTAETAMSEDAQRAALQALAAARSACVAAAEALPEEGGPLYHLATITQVTGEHRQAVRLYERAAEAGVGAAYARLGDYYNFGIRPVREDIDEAVRLYRAGAELGDSESQTTLALMHQLGRGVPRDPERMVSLLGAAADQGYHFAQYRLAQIYLSGDDLPDGPDAAAAVPLLAGAARAGNYEAALELAQLYDAGADGVRPNAFARYRWVNYVAETGDAAAIALRAFLTEQGLGTAQDPEFAAAQYVVALETGAIDPAEMRGTINGRVPEWERETALAFQRILQERGLYNGALDAIVGPGTLGGARRLAE